MTTDELEYFYELTARVSDEYDPTFVSFANYDMENPDNLINEISSSPYPRVLCAFLEAGKFHTDDDLILFKEFSPPSEEEVKLLLEEYGTRIPEYITLLCNASSLDWHDDSWKAIQRLRVSPKDMTYMYTTYTLMLDTQVVHGKGMIPISCISTLDYHRIITFD